MSGAAGARIYGRLVPSNLGRLVYFQRPVDEGRQPNDDEEIPDQRRADRAVWRRADGRRTAKTRDIRPEQPKTRSGGPVKPSPFSSATRPMAVKSRPSSWFSAGRVDDHTA